MTEATDIIIQELLAEVAYNHEDWTYKIYLLDNGDIIITDSKQKVGKAIAPRYEADAYFLAYLKSQFNCRLESLIEYENTIVFTPGAVKTWEELKQQLLIYRLLEG